MPNMKMRNKEKCRAGKCRTGKYGTNKSRAGKCEKYGGPLVPDKKNKFNS